MKRNLKHYLFQQLSKEWLFASSNCFDLIHSALFPLIYLCDYFLTSCRCLLKCPHHQYGTLTETALPLPLLSYQFLNPQWCLIFKEHFHLLTCYTFMFIVYLVT